MPKAEALVERIEAFHHARRGEIVVRKVARGYSLLSARTGAPIARLRPTGEAGSARISQMDWRSAGALHRFQLSDQAFTASRVAES